MRSPRAREPADAAGTSFLAFFLACALAGPAFAAPDEELLGKDKGYPVGTRANWFFEEGVRVGSFSRIDEILPYNRLGKAASPLPFTAAGDEAKFDYRFETRAGRSTIFSRTSASMAADHEIHRRRVLFLVLCHVAAGIRKPSQKLTIGYRSQRACLFAKTASASSKRRTARSGSNGPSSRVSGSHSLLCEGSKKSPPYT